MGDVVAFQPRLGLPEGADNEYGLTIANWRVLTDQVFPAAKDPMVVLLALDYCRARNLDIMKKPVHIVEVYDSDAGRYIEQIWPSINEVQTTAARTGEWGGLDAPEFGTLITRTFEGVIKVGNNQTKDISSTVTYPEWCKVTVYRIVKGIRCAFTERRDFVEVMVEQQRSGVPNSRWSKAPKQYLSKCTKAASLRAAFPEEVGYCAEEMEGRDVGNGSAYTKGRVIDAEAIEQPAVSPEDQGWILQHPENRAVIDARKVKPDYGEAPATVTQFITKVVDRYQATGADQACLALLHERLAHSFESLHTALYELHQAMTTPTRKAKTF
jgi:phage recombination protein Bet